jgi:transcriptional regulator with XRE-family HTH domain
MRISDTTTDDAALTELGRRLERVRLDRNLTQEQLATEAGISRQTLGRIEAGGAAKLPALVRVLRALGMLDALDAAIPEPLPSPIEQLRRQGRQRRRARPAPTPPPSEHAADLADDPDGGWTWGTR